MKNSYMLYMTFMYAYNDIYFIYHINEKERCV